VHRSDDADEEIEADAVSVLQSRADRLRADPRDAYLALRIVGKLIVHVVGELAVNADRL
jgi:hypothetical protein